MSVWNRLGDLAKGVGNFGQDVVGAAVATPRFIWDVATSPFNDAKEFNGVANTLVNAGKRAAGSVVAPVVDILQAPVVKPTLEKIDRINQEVLREPAATLNLVIGDVKAGKGNLFDPNEWKKAYEGAQSISVGQAAAYNLGLGVNFGTKPNFNIYDPAQRDKAFKQSLWGKAVSGGLDTVAQLGLDVTIGAGKAIKLAKASELVNGVIKNADDAAKAAEEITKTQYGVKNRFTKIVDDFTKNDSAYALNHPMVKSSTSPGLLAHMLGQSTDRNQTAEILRASLGDPQAMADLAAKRADIAQAIDLANANIFDSVDIARLNATPNVNGMVPLPFMDPAVIADADAATKALAANDKYLSDLMQLGKGGGSLTRTTGVLKQGAEDVIAKSRAAKYPNLEIYQPTPFHRMYQKVSWAAGERPAGIVDFNDPDSYREVVATINSANKAIKLAPEEQKALLDSYISAANPEERFQATLALEENLFGRIAQKYNVDPEDARTIYNGYKLARTSALQSLKDKGYMVDLDKSIIKVPQLESQSANHLPIMDFELMDRLLKRNAEDLTLLGIAQNKAGKIVDTGLHFMDFLQDMFKAGALLRLGYTLRNGLDSQLRIAGSVGAMASLSHLGKGMSDVIYNSAQAPKRLIDNYRHIPGMDLNIKQLEKSRVGIIKEIEELDKHIAGLKKKAEKFPDDPNLPAEINVNEMLRMEKRGLHEHYNEVIANNTKDKVKKTIGTGTFEVTTSDGRKYLVDDAYGGKLGDLFRQNTSSASSFERMVDSNTDLYAKNLRSQGIQAVTPTDPAYYEQWAQTLNNQFGNSAVARKLAAGESIKDVTKWLKATPQGRDLRARLGAQADDSEEYVTKIAGFLDQYLPESSGLRSQLGDITAGQLRKTFTDIDSLPVIHGHILKRTIDNLDRVNFKRIINGLFKVLGTMPEDAWARHPLYIKLYRDEMKRRLEVMDGLKQTHVTQAEQAEMMSQAHKLATRQMKQILFNIERKSNLAAALKYISPFFSAQENAYKTWTRMAMDNPAIINKGYQAWQAPNRAGLVTDQEGNPVPVGKTSGNDTIWIQMPKGAKNIPIFGPGLAALNDVGVPKRSLDVMFQGGLDTLYNQGSPVAFGDVFPLGPYVGIPASELVKKYEGKVPGIADAFKWALPFGTSKSAGSLDQLLPAWYKRAQVLTEGQGNSLYAQAYQKIWTTAQHDAKAAGLPPVTPEAVAKMTGDFYKMRTAANLILPFAPKFESPYRYYIDQYRNYQKQFGINADDKFLQDYPDFFEFSASLSKNPTGIQSTEAAVANARKYPELVGKLYSEMPQLVGFVVNDPKDSQFSSAAYNWLSTNKVAADSPDTFKQAQSPIEARKKVEANKGWITFGKVQDALDAELMTRGLTSLSQKGAEDLKALKEFFVNKLGTVTDAQGKPVIDKKTGQVQRTPWYDDYQDTDGSKTNRVIAGLGTILSDKKFLDAHGEDPIWKSASIYLQARQSLAQELAARKAAGGAGSIDAVANQDLNIVYKTIVNKLTKQDDGFKQMYTRLLQNDLIYDKYLTPKPTLKVGK